MPGELLLCVRGEVINFDDLWDWDWEDWDWEVGIFREAPQTPLNSDTEQVSGRRPKVEATAKKRHRYLAWELAWEAEPFQILM